MRTFLFSLLLLTAALAVAQKKATVEGHSAATSPKRTETSPYLPTEEEVNSFLHETFGVNQQLTWKVATIKPAEAKGLAEVTVQISSPEGQGVQKFFVTADGKHAVVGDLIPFGRHPFEAARLELKKRANGPSRGPVDAPVVIVEFSDLQCPHCKQANPTVERLLSENPNIRFISQNFPLPLHNWAAKAAAYADCVGRASNESYWKFVDGVFGVQEQITAENADEKLSGIADAAGIKGSDTAVCAARPETQARVEASVKLGQEVGVNSTPTLFVNGRPVGIGSNNYDALKQVVDFAAQNK